MRSRDRIDRRGPGLIASMSRSAVIASGPGAARTISMRRTHTSPDRAAEASDRYQQLCDLLEDGILAAPEFEAAVARLTSGFAGASLLGGSWGGTPPESPGHEGRGRSH